MKMLSTFAIVTIATILLCNNVCKAQLQIGFHYKVKNTYLLHYVLKDTTVSGTDTTITTYHYSPDMPVGSEKVISKDIKYKIEVSDPNHEITTTTITTTTIDETTVTGMPAVKNVLPTITKGPVTVVAKTKIDYTTDPDPIVLSYTMTIKTIDRPAKRICGNYLNAGLNQSEDGKVIVDFWGITSEPAGCDVDGIISLKNKLGEFYYQIDKKKTLNTVTTYLPIPYATWEVGVATIPFKNRFGYKKDTINVPNDATLNVNAGVYFSRKWGWTNYYYDKTKTVNSNSIAIAAFFTPMAIPISPKNTFPQKDADDIKKIGKEPNELGLSFGAGLMMAHKNLNFGLLVGLDFGVTGMSKYWYYKNKPWLGIGFGYKLAILGDK